MSIRRLVVAAIFCVSAVAAVWVWAGAWLDGTGAPTGHQAAAAQGAGVDRFRPTMPPKPLPAFTFTDGEGRVRTMGDFKGKVVLLNLWATWCGPCVKEMPSLDRLQGALGGDRFQVVALSTDRGGGVAVVPFYAKLGIARLGVYLDPAGGSMTALGPRGLPTTLLIDPDGREAARLEGGVEWDSPAMLAFLRTMAGAADGAAPPGAAPSAAGGLIRTAN